MTVSEQSEAERAAVGGSGQEKAMTALLNSKTRAARWLASRRSSA
jgi:hypothetical protein